MWFWVLSAQNLFEMQKQSVCVEKSAKICISQNGSDPSKKAAYLEAWLYTGFLAFGVLAFNSYLYCSSDLCYLCVLQNCSLA